APAPGGKSAILVGQDVVEQIALPSGVELARTSGFPERGFAPNDEYVLADDRGRLFAFNDSATQLWIIDVKRNRRAHIEAAWFEGLRATRIEKDGTFLLLRATDSDEQL